MALTVIDNTILKLDENSVNASLSRIYQLIRELDDKFYIGTTTPTNITKGYIWIKTDEPDELMVRVYNGSVWKVIPTMDI